MQVLAVLADMRKQWDGQSCPVDCLERVLSSHVVIYIWNVKESLQQSTVPFYHYGLFQSGSCLLVRYDLLRRNCAHFSSLRASDYEDGGTNTELQMMDIHLECLELFSAPHPHNIRSPPHLQAAMQGQGLLMLLYTLRKPVFLGVCLR